MSDVQKRIETLTHFCGYGNPETAKIFFMGLEEHHTVHCTGDSFSNFEKELIAARTISGEHWLYTASVGGPTGITERTQCSIYSALFPNAPKEDQIFKNEIHCFNFYPLGAHSVRHYPSHYNECFGFETKSSLYNYFDNASRRKEILASFIREKIIKEEKVLFVLGVSGWQKAEDLLGLECKNQFDRWNNRRKGKPSEIRWSDNKQVWLTGHPSYGWINGEVVKKIASIWREQ